MNGFMNLFQAYVGFRSIGNGSLAHVDQKIIRRTIENGTLLGFPAIIVDEDIAHNGKQPGLDVGAYIILFLVRERLEKGFLVKIIGGFTVPCQIDGKGLEKVRILKQNLIEICVGHRFLFNIMSNKVKQNN
jgi:hypothetical protein